MVILMVNLIIIVKDKYKQYEIIDLNHEIFNSNNLDKNNTQNKDKNN
jgi:hypothetical protein